MLRFISIHWLFVFLMVMNSCKTTSQSSLVEDDAMPEDPSKVWLTDYSAGYEQAKAEKKKLLIYFEATNKFPAHKQFEKEVLADAEVISNLGSVIKVRIPDSFVSDNRVLLKDAYFQKMDGYAGVIIIDLRDKIVAPLALPFLEPGPYNTHDFVSMGAKYVPWSLEQFKFISSLQNEDTVEMQKAYREKFGKGSTPTPSASGQSVTSATGIRGEILRLINEYRASRGLSQMVYDPRLDIADDASHSNFYAHGFSSPPQAAAYAWGSCGSALATVNMWKGSPPHNRQMLTPGLRRGGVGFRGNTCNWVGTP